MPGPLISVLLLSFVPPFEARFGFHVRPVFHILAAELAIIGLGCRVLRMLVDDEQSEESRRELPHRLIGLNWREVVPEHGVLVAPGVVLRNELQFFFVFVISPPCDGLRRGDCDLAKHDQVSRSVLSPTVSRAMRVRNTLSETMSSSRSLNDPRAPRWF